MTSVLQIPYALHQGSIWVLPDADLSDYGGYVTDLKDGLRAISADTPISCFSYVVTQEKTHYQKHSPCSICRHHLACRWDGTQEYKFERAHAQAIKLVDGFDLVKFQQDNRQVTIEELRALCPASTTSSAQPSEKPSDQMQTEEVS